MSIEVKYAYDGTGVIYIGEDTISGDDILWANESVYQSEDDFKKIRFFLYDYTKATSTTFTTEELHRSIQQDKAAAQINPNIVVAIAAKADLIFGMYRMWKSSLGEITWETFITRSLSAAKNWIKEQTGLEVI